MLAFGVIGTAMGRPFAGTGTLGAAIVPVSSFSLQKIEDHVILDEIHRFLVRGVP
ncbi:hypothetical protein [Streptosporangium sp. NPDC000396]|uniref:hypothetical protein n=1 Tax=Streptosporangium sp. NPDC000396 TaxID=3366185 RepID=UPI0036BCA2EC